ncbi:MAG: hypothetical protein CMJ24_03230 [Phycisphaerae bacterium]|jgi:hypothetical protein|nr:hypothetical protein [Phycisphaerae bacterium]|tara:strand:- start:782 stop:1201 length:420 start_codon:yes stop_codon:yes gene_type:complete
MIPRSRNELGTALGWAVETETDPSMATADWLVQDATRSSGIFALVNDPEVSIDTLRQLKEAFKAWRVMGENSRDRRMAACCYALVIAAGLVHHGERISTQSDSALHRSFQSLRIEMQYAEHVRGLVDQAIARLDVPGTD